MYTNETIASLILALAGVCNRQDTIQLSENGRSEWSHKIDLQYQSEYVHCIPRYIGNTTALPPLDPDQHRTAHTWTVSMENIGNYLSR